ncbi:MAG: DinB family protein [Candidatus Thorarchaeota archaeon]|jgi:hypothetical protein
MSELNMVKSLVKTTREWRERALDSFLECDGLDLSYKPSTGMSSAGWLLAHQAAVYDFSLNVLIRNNPPSNPKLFQFYIPGTSGDWMDTPLDEIAEYYSSGENDFLNWFENIPLQELDNIIDREEVPKFFQGMTLWEVIGNMFCHINRHTGHLNSLRRDWLSKTI